MKSQCGQVWWKGFLELFQSFNLHPLECSGLGSRLGFGDRPRQVNPTAGGSTLIACLQFLPADLHARVNSFLGKAWYWRVYNVDLTELTKKSWSVIYSDGSKAELAFVAVVPNKYIESRYTCLQTHLSTHSSSSKQSEDHHSLSVPVVRPTPFQNRQINA